MPRPAPAEGLMGPRRGSASKLAKPNGEGAPLAAVVGFCIRDDGAAVGAAAGWPVNLAVLPAKSKSLPAERCQRAVCRYSLSVSRPHQSLRRPQRCRR